MGCVGFHTTMRVTFRERANRVTSSALRGPLSVTVSAPSTWARWRCSVTRLRASAESRSDAGVSTYALRRPTLWLLLLATALAAVLAYQVNRDEEATGFER